MQKRERYRGVQPCNVILEVPVSDTPQWSCGKDVPLTWKRKELLRLGIQTIKDNYRRGVINGKTMKSMINRVRKEHGKSR